MAQINKPNEYFNTVLYSGTGSNQSVTGTGFTTDLLWIKERNDADFHFVNDSVRGIGTNGHYLNLHTNATNAESDQTTGVNAINSNGFDITYRGELNESGKTYVSWNWLAGGSASSNTDGSITSTVSANTTSGFSIVSYTGNGTAGATVGHGLGVAPKMIIAKVRSTGEDWPVYHASLGATKYIKLSSTGASETITSIFNDTEPTSSVFSLGTQNKINMNTQTFIAYCFAEKKGFSKFGSYTGNGSTDGTFVYTGFKPAWIMVKRTDSLGAWFMFDNKRLGYNSENYRLIADTNDAEADPGEYDILSNGFKPRFTSANANASGGSYIFMAFAESPLVGTNNTPATAR